MKRKLMCMTSVVFIIYTFVCHKQSLLQHANRSVTSTSNFKVVERKRGTEMLIEIGRYRNES